MGRNLIGGKNYKKAKHAVEKTPYAERADDQQYARILKILGNRNTLAYCNDNVTRLCHIRGSLRKDSWIGVGDIVLISCRGLESSTDKYEKADILYKYDRDYHSRLRREKDINEKLFLQLELANDGTLNMIKQNKIQHDDDNIIFENDDDEEEEDVDIDNI